MRSTLGRRSAPAMRSTSRACTSTIPVSLVVAPATASLRLDAAQRGDGAATGQSGSARWRFPLSATTVSGR